MRNKNVVLVSTLVGLGLLMIKGGVEAQSPAPDTSPTQLELRRELVDMLKDCQRQVNDLKTELAAQKKMNEEQAVVIGVLKNDVGNLQVQMAEQRSLMQEVWWGLRAQMAWQWYRDHKPSYDSRP